MVDNKNNTESKTTENKVEDVATKQQVEQAKKDLMKDAEELAKEHNIDLDSMTDGKKVWSKCNKKECRDTKKELDEIKPKFENLSNLFVGEYERRMFLLTENMKFIVQLYGSDIVKILIDRCAKEMKELEEKAKKETDSKTDSKDELINKEEKGEVMFRITEGGLYSQEIIRYSGEDFPHAKLIKLDEVVVDYTPEKDEYNFVISVGTNKTEHKTRGSLKFQDVVYLEMFVNGALKEKKVIRSQATNIEKPIDEANEQKKENEPTKTN